MNENRTKTISIFIGSSINEFREERMELENFIHRLSNDFEDKYNTRIRPIVCEAFDPAMSLTRKQDEYNESLKKSDMCFFLFYTRAGDYTVEEFHNAVEAFKKNNTPKVYVYFKKLNEGDSVEQSLTDFMKEVDKTYRHYYSTFAYLDTVKLCILLNIKLNAMDYLPIDVNDGKCKVDGKDMWDIDLTKVTEFANSREIKALQNELAHTEEQYLHMKSIYVQGEADEDFYKEYAKIAAKREKLKNELEELRKATFELMLNINRNFAAGEISPRMKEAHRLLELGDKENCVRLLTEDENIDEYHLRQKRRAEVRKRLEEEAKNDAGNYIREQRFAISVLTTMYLYANRHSEIDRIYRNIVVEAEEYFVECDVLYDYAVFLWEQKQYNEAISYAEKLQAYYNNGIITVSEHNVVQLSNLLGILYVSTNRFAEAEEHFNKSIEIRERLAQVNPAAYEAYLAMGYNNIGVLYKDTQRFIKAEECHKKAIEIRERLAEANPVAYKPDLAMSYNNLGILYSSNQKFVEAEKCYDKAIWIYERLAQVIPAVYESALAMSYNNLGILYEDTQRFTEAEECHKKAIEIRGRLSEANPVAYNPDLAMSYNNLGILYEDTQRFTEAEECYKKAISIRERLAQNNPTTYDSNLANSYYNFGGLYKNIKRFAEAEDYYKKAIAIYVRLAEVNPAVYDPDLAKSYNNLGNVYKKTKKLAEAEECYKKVVEIRARLAEANSDTYELDLAGSYNNLGILYKNTAKFAKAEECYNKAIEIYERLGQNNSKAYGSYLAISYNNLGVLFYNTKRYTQAVEWYNKAIAIYEQLVQNNPSVYEPALASSYYNLGGVYLKLRDYTCAEEYFKKARKVFVGLELENPGSYIDNIQRCEHFLQAL